jgi:hypothetical protein
VTSGEGVVDDTPFLTTEEFVQFHRPLTTTEEPFVLLLLKAAARWIRLRKPDIPADDSAAKLVSITVVKDAMDTGRYRRMIQYSRTIGERMESGTVASPGDVLYFAPGMYELLGISQTAQPKYRFDDCGPVAQW